MKTIKDKLNLALSLQYGPENRPAFLEEYPVKYFTALEIPGNVLDDSSIKQKLKQKGITKIHLTNLMDSSLTGSVAEQPARFIEDFKSWLRKIICIAAGHNINSMTMDFSLDLSIQNEDYHRNRIKFLKSICPLLHEREMRLCLPIRVPYAIDGIADYYLKFLTELMCPLCRICVNINPHELKKDYSPVEILRWLKFDIEVLRFVYEPEIGNRLVDKQVRPWLDYLGQMAFQGIIVFAPKVSSADFYLHEAEEIVKISGIGQNE